MESCTAFRRFRVYSLGFKLVSHPRCGVLRFLSLCCPRPPPGAYLQCSMATYSCGAQRPKILAVPSRRVSLQCPTTKYPCSAQPQNISAVPNRRESPQCPTAEYHTTLCNILAAKPPGNTAFPVHNSRG